MILRAAAVFTSHMVLQQGTAVPVWGHAAPGSEIQGFLCMDCRENGVTACTHADNQGRWELRFPAMRAGGPYTLTLESGGEELRFTQVYVGEVWLAGGQSNMELALIDSDDGAAVVAACNDPRLHFYETPKVTTPEQAEQAESGWKVIRPETGAGVSAVAYYAARELARKLDVHVGILECFWGGTFAHCWMPRNLLAQFPEGQSRLDWYDAQVGDKTDGEFDEECRAYQTRVDSWNRAVAARRAEDPQVSWAVLNVECGLFPWPPPAGRTGYQRPGNLYESMLSRICPYAIRGFWYYQGCQDEPWPQDYAALLRNLVRRWRADWNDPDGKLPFLLVQLPMFETGFPGSWPVIRAAQSRIAHSEPNAGLVVLADCGERDNIHPTDKHTPGSRLGLLALDMVYHRPVQGRAPEAVSARFEGDRVTVRFVQTAGTLVLNGKGEGFQVAGSDGLFLPAAAKVLEPDGVQVICPEVSEPVAVRYAWENYCPADLHGGTGLAAAPFMIEKGHFHGSGQA